MEEQVLAEVGELVGAARAVAAIEGRGEERRAAEQGTLAARQEGVVVALGQRQRPRTRVERPRAAWGPTKTNSV